MKSSAAGSSVAVPLLASPVAASSVALRLSCSSTMVLLIVGSVVEDRRQVGTGVAVDVGDHAGLLEVLLQRGQLRIQLLQIVIQPRQ